MKNHLCPVLFLFIFSSAIIASGQMYTYHNTWPDANGNVIADNVTQGSGGYGKTSYAYAHIQMPSGYQNSKTSTGNAFAEAVTQASAYGESGQFIFSGYNEINDLCWDSDDYSDFQEPLTLPPYQVEPISTAFQSPATCPAGKAGWARNTTNQVQYYGGRPYAFDGLIVADLITPSGTVNALGINSAQTGHTPTTGDGSFQDTYFVCSTACPQSSGESDALQTWTVNSLGLPHVNAVIYKCSSITIDGR